jgi:hypothetical protein
MEGRTAVRPNYALLPARHPGDIVQAQPEYVAQEQRRVQRQLVFATYGPTAPISGEAWLSDFPIS